MQLEAIGTRYNLIRLDFTLANLAANQDGTAIPINANAVKHTMPWRGSVVGMAVSLSEAVTAENVLFKCLVNTTEYATLSVNLSASGSTTYGTAIVPFESIPFAANDEIGMVYDSHASFTPTTADVVVSLYVMFAECQF